MSDEVQRPDPDALLKAVQKDGEGKGKLKIFFGMAAGVGKTYAMLEAGQAAKRDGLDVVIGYLESHLRRETDELAAGLEQVPRLVLGYRGRTLQEMDTDAVVRRAPRLVLVDELAHTNAPGARNRKRYQDVMELIERGIDVYTTVNVQHLEGFADAVEAISGITIAERIPDSVFDAADQVVLIDLSPEELLKRLSEGKVYLGDRAQAAAENFFKKSTLSALREMALRHTALLVNHQLTDMLHQGARTGASAAGEHLLVAVSPSPNSAHLIRWTRQRAFNLKAEWTALFVDTGAAISEAARESLRKNMNLARQLGAAMVTIPADDVALAVIRYARERGVSEIVVGKAGIVGRPFLRRRTLVERIMKMSGDIDVAVVQEKGAAPRRPRLRLSTYLRPERASLLKMVLVVAVVTGLGVLARPLIGYRSVSIVYLMAVIVLALFTSRLAVILGAVLSAILWDFLFLPPLYTFVITKLEDVLMFFLYFVTAAALAFLMSRLRANQRMLGIRERRMSLLLDFSQSLSQRQALDGIVLAGLEYVSRYFEAEVIAFLAGPGGTLEHAPRSLADIASVDEKEYGVARWCFDSRTPCGAYTDTLHMARFHYIPLLTPGGAVGVLGVSRRRDTTWLPEHEDALQMLGRTLALAVERELLADENRRNLMARESERLGRVLLNTVSHELRTPLTAIKGSISALMDPVTGEDPEARRLLMEETLTATDRLNAIVENLLSMSRLESGMLRLKRSDTDPQDLVSVASDALRRQSSDHPLSVHVEENIPAVSLDFTLMVQALANLLANAARHTPPGTPIELSAESTSDGLSLTVADEGPGVAPEELPHLFETFYRGRNAATGGVGLGLPICKGIVEAHGGRIVAFLNRKGGLSVNIVLPGSLSSPHAAEEPAGGGASA
ncbi:MAG TPA: sensor histidine kinase KdpD [Spirochaetia bacterium]|nr:sensor histidine kinase KdpD [Spirochaetia bacterium]